MQAAKFSGAIRIEIRVIDRRWRELPLGALRVVARVLTRAALAVWGTLNTIGSAMATFCLKAPGVTAGLVTVLAKDFAHGMVGMARAISEAIVRAMDYAGVSLGLSSDAASTALFRVAKRVRGAGGEFAGATFVPPCVQSAPCALPRRPPGILGLTLL